MTNKLVVIINSLKVPTILLYEMKFLVPNYSCLQNPWLGGLPPPDPRSLCPLSWTEFVEPPLRTKFLGTPLLPCFSIYSHLTPILYFIFPSSALTSPSHLKLHLPILLTAIGLHSIILFTVSSLSSLTICPVHLILCAFMNLTTSACLISKSIS